MPRKCIICGASQSFNLAIFSFPKLNPERAAWISVIQEVIPGYSDPQNLDTVAGPRSGICERHFRPEDIKKGKTSSLIKTAVPMRQVESRDLPDGEMRTTSDGHKAEMNVNTSKNSVAPNCLTDNISDYLTDTPCIEPKENTFEPSVYFDQTELVNDICLVCGKGVKNLVLFSNIQNHCDISSSTSVSLLTRIVGKPKREIFIVSLKICTRCINLIQEFSHLEEDLKVKRQSIKDMFDATLHEYRERAKTISDTSSSPSLQSHDLDYNGTPCNSLMVDGSHFSASDRFSGQGRSSSRRQMSSKEYYCSSCKESFQSLALWVQHCSKHTENDDPKGTDNSKKSFRVKKRRKLGIYKCEDCDETFYSRQSLLGHAPAHQKGTECNVCGRYLSTKARLKVHLFKMHEIGEEKNKEIECADCGKSFSTKAGLRYHRNVIHHVGTKYVCEQCDKVFYYHVPYRSHLLYTHGEKKVICETCGEKFFTVAKLNGHINAVHRSAKSWECKECKSKFTTDTAYRHHMNLKHLKVQHVCEICRTNFRKKSSLIMHLWKHSVFICQLCKESFSRTDDLKAHMSETHGKEVMLKGKRKHSNQLVHKRREESILQQKPEEAVQQNEHVTSIVINDLLIAAESYSNSGLQSFRLSECEKLPEKRDYSTGEELKVEPMGIIDTTPDLQSVDAVQFDAVESLQIKSSPDQIEMAPGVSLINVQILGDMEISQSDALDLKTSMLADAADHMSHDGQLDNEDNITGRLTVETHHLTADELSVGNDLASSSHTLDHSDHLETPCHLEVTGALDAATHLEVTHQLDNSHQLQVETGTHLEVTRHLESEGHMDAADNLEGVAGLDSSGRDGSGRCCENSDSRLKAAEHIEPKDHLDIASHMGDSALGDSSRLEATDQCSLPSMISQIDNQVTEEIASHMSPHMHDIAGDVDTGITSHIGSDIHDIASEVDSQMVDSVGDHMATQMQAQIDQISANVDEVDDDMVAQINPNISTIGSEVSTQIVDHVETRISSNIDPHMVQGDADIVSQSLDKQLEKIDDVELEPFSVTLDQKNVQYQYVMYISASAEDSNPD